MDRKQASLLVEELSKHPWIITPDSVLFTDVLAETVMNESRRFYEPTADKQQSVDESGQTHTLSLRRVLRNNQAGGYHLPQWKGGLAGVASILGVYSSDILTRDIRKNLDLVDMMLQCEHPYSLLGKFQTVDYSIGNGNTVIVTRPVLVIPGVEDTTKITEWENAHTTYEKEGFFGTRKRISRERYLAT